jgi:DNA-directed RNA polymerase subunit RPC12/RpoP
MLESFECPNCQATLDYDAQSQALTVRCTYCGSTVIVPDSLRNQRSSRNAPEVLAEVVQLVQNGRKIEAIKLFRERFSVGLKEAKDVVDAIERHEDIHLGGTDFHTESATVTFTSTPPVQTSSGRGGCSILLIALVLVAIGAAAFFFIGPTDRSEISEVIEQITTITESQSETTTTTQDEISIVISTVEAAIPGAPGISTDSEFAEVVLRIGGEEGTGPGFFNDTRRLALDGDGHIYTGDYSGGRIQVFDANGEFVTTWNAGQDLYLAGIAANRAGIIYVIKTNSIETYNGLTGEFLGTITIPNSQSTYFRTAASGPDGSVYFIAKDRLVRLDNNGNITLDISDPFANIPDFATTQEDAAIDGAGNIYMLGSETIYKLNAQGQFVDQIGSKGEAEDQFFTSPRSIAVDGQGRIFVDDFWGIKVFEGNGRYLTILESPGVSFDMMFNDDNELLVMDRNSNELRKYQLNQ